MQASDDAMDEIDLFAGLERREKRKKPADRRTTEDLLVEHLTPSRCAEFPQGVLGLAEAVLERGISLDCIRLQVDSALASELSPDRLDCWREPERRQAALFRFRDRLNGVPVDPALIAEDNEGLFSKVHQHTKLMDIMSKLGRPVDPG